MEADRKQMQGDSNMVPDHHEEKSTYRAGNKVIFTFSDGFYM